MIDLLIIPSYTEGIPSVIYEAFAAKTPVVATNVGSISSLIKNNNIETILDKIEYLYKNQYLLKEVSGKAYTELINSYDEKNIINKWREIMNKL